MNHAEQKIESQVQFWALLGPFVTSLTFILLLLKASGDWQMPLVGLTGIVLCWQWRIKGLAGSLVLLLAFLTYHGFYVHSADLYWNIGISVSLALSFAITALSFDEITSMVMPLHKEILGKQDSLWQLDGQLKAATDRVATHEELLAKSEFAMEAARKEVLYLSQRQEQMMQDLFEARTSASKSSEELELVNAELERLRTMLCEQDQGDSESQLLLAKKQEEFDALQASYAQLKDEQVLQQAIALEMSEHIETVTREKDLLETTLTRLQKEYENLHNHCQDLSVAAKATPQPVQVTVNNSELEEQIRDLKAKLNNALYQQGEYQNKISSLRMLSDQFLDLQMRNENVTNERDALRRRVEALEEIPRDARIANGRYAQLRKQFDEKTALLDATRQELFRAHEQIEALHREMNEHSYALDEGTISHVLAQADAEIASLQSAHNQEVESLHAIIRSLNDQKSI